jgi:HD-like signal output (HDOD) protein/prolyl-tRNA editing enzyme YbaK/EbsC (Cys-tRNA(Pro) deacylase)
MTLPASIAAFLAAEGVPYQLLTAAPVASQVAVASLLRDRYGPLLVIHPANERPDITELNRQLNREFTAPATPDLPRACADCEAGAVPPLVTLYGFRGIVEQRLYAQEQVCFQGGNAHTRVSVDVRDFRRLQRGAWQGERLSQPVPADALPLSRAAAPALQQEVEGLQRLPAMPELASRILQLRANPYAGTTDLARVVERDPSLAAQVLRYARSPLYGFSGRIESVADAILHVLGWDLVLNLALGLSLGRGLRLPRAGPLGLERYWRDAVYSATLAQGLARLLPQPVKPGLAYLCGLLHDFGLLVLGHLRPQEYACLQQARSSAPKVPLLTLEQGHCSAPHTELGGWLLTAWQLPDEVRTVARAHHEAHYQGMHAGYVQLIQVVNALLGPHGLGETDDPSPQALYAALGLSGEHARAVLEGVLAQGQDLDVMAGQLAA